MQVLLHKCFGPGYAEKEISLRDVMYSDSVNDYHTDSFLIDIIKNKLPEQTSFVVVELSDEVTEYTIIDYDGLESIIYIEDGHLYKAYYDDDINDIVRVHVGCLV